jgi:hypothetical protein
MAKETCLFSKKELYVMEHNEKGKSRRTDKIPERHRRKMIYENMHLMKGMSFTSSNHFPQLAPYNGNVEFEVIPYSDRKKYDGRNQALHFFLDDYRFRDAIWCNLDYTTYSIRNYDYYFTPDLSLWVDLPTDFCNKENIYRTRFVGAYWQLCGYNVIPTASWGNADSFKYCFEGLPENSVIAVGGMGHHHCRAAESLWHYALQELERQKHPTLILIYGDEEDLSYLATPVKFIPCFISKRLRNGK